MGHDVERKNGNDNRGYQEFPHAQNPSKSLEYPHTKVIHFTTTQRKPRQWRLYR
jgi:hypothetical protein